MSECIITRRGGGAFSTLPVLNENYPKDKSVTFISGNTATASFEVKIDVDGKPAEYTYQWYLDGKPVSGATNSSFTIHMNDSSVGTHSVSCDVTNEAGTVGSRVATLSVEMYYKPVLNPNFPADVSCRVHNGANTTFKVGFEKHGYPTEYTYKWYQVNSDGSVHLLNSTGSSHVYPSLLGAGTWGIYCEVTNIAGTVRSRTATLTVTDAYLYSWGNEYTNVTGGWQMTRALNASSQPNYSLGNFSKSTSGMTMHLWSNSGHDGFIGTYNKIDLTHYSKIEFVINDSYSNCSNSYNHYFCATSINDNNGATQGIVAQTAVALPLNESTQATRTYYVDVSGINGAYYVGVLSWVWIAESRIRVCSVRLIP